MHTYKTDATYSVFVNVMFIPLLEIWPPLRNNDMKLSHAPGTQLTELKASYVLTPQKNNMGTREETVRWQEE
jgi:hypothetical protein